MFLSYIVLISGSLGPRPRDPGVILLVCFCKYASLLLNN